MLCSLLPLVHPVGRVMMAHCLDITTLKTSYNVNRKKTQIIETQNLQNIFFLMPTKKLNLIPKQNGALKKTGATDPVALPLDPPLD